MTKTYSTPANARRAAKGFIAKADMENIEVEVRAVEEGAVVILTFPEVDNELAAAARERGFNVIQPDVEGATQERRASGYINETSRVDGPVCAMVWDICDELVGQPRKDVIAECRRRGIAYGTARTQYQKWKQATGK